MTLKFLGIIPNTPTDESPTIWQDEATGDLLIQSYKATADEVRQCQEIGSIPGHSTAVPDNETIVRLPAVMHAPPSPVEERQVQPPARNALAKARRSAVHLELHDSYMRDDPEYLAWQDGKRWDPAARSEWWGGWHDAVRGAVDRGVVVRRARIVSEPLSDYVRYEHHRTFTNLAAGESVRWLPRRRTTDLCLPGTDFRLFDGTQALFHHFTGEGQLAEDGREYTDDPVRVKLCADAFEAVWRRAIPHEEYRPH